MSLSRTAPLGALLAVAALALSACGAAPHNESTTADGTDPGVPVVLVGDFNCPSHLDRPDVAWPVTLAAEEAGLRDSYREAHPDPAADPGHTWSPVHTLHEDGSGRPEPQDRIDFVLHRGLTVLDSRTLVRGTPRCWPDVAANEWPSDHAAVITDFTVPLAGVAEGAFTSR